MKNIPKDPVAYRAWWAQERPDISYGYCWCGCGKQTKLSPYDQPSRNYFKGEPRRYINQHQNDPKVRVAPLSSRYIVEDRGYETPCWVWKKPNAKGYAMLWIDGRYYLAHRILYEQKYGPIPEGLEPDHLCRVRACINSDHLDLVSHAVNMQRGSQAKLTVDQVRAVKLLQRATSLTHRQIASVVGASFDQVAHIAHGKTWRNVH